MTILLTNPGPSFTSVKSLHALHGCSLDFWDYVGPDCCLFPRPSLYLQTVLEIETIRLYASLTSAWITDFHPNVAYLLAYFDFNEVRAHC